MRYLLNVPLLFAVLVGCWVAYLILFAAPAPGSDRSMSEGFTMVVANILCWLALAIVLACCAGMGEFNWLPVQGSTAVVVTLLGCAAIVLVSLLPIGITWEDNAALKWGIDQVGTARLAALGLPLVLALYAVWVVNAPAALRGSLVLHYAALLTIFALCVVASIVSIRELARWDKAAQADAVTRQQVETDKMQERRQAFAALTDAEPLLAWDEYVSAQLPEDVRIEALRRIGLRPNIDAELAEALTTDNTLWTREALSLVANVPFKPSPVLEKPVRDALAIITEEIRQRATAADNRDGDKAVDYYETSTLRACLGAAERMADSPGSDLRDRLDQLQQVVALYPKSDAARSFPAQLAAAKARIAERLAARHG
jgi:hypothetical protein